MTKPHKNFENTLPEVTLNDGELLYIEDADIEIINGGEKGYSNTVLIEKFTKSEIIGYDILNKDHWEEGLAKEDYACAEYDCGRYMIMYLDGQYHVYHDDMTVDEEDHFIGVFNSEEQVDEAATDDSIQDNVEVVEEAVTEEISSEN